MRNTDQDPTFNWKVKVDPTICFLFCCLDPSRNSQATEEIQQQIQGEIDWDYLIEFAKIHYVIPLLYRRLKSTCPELVPAEALSKMHRMYQDLTVQSLLLSNELTTLLKAMIADGIDVLPYKGPVLAQALYDDIELRQFGDLDIIIQPHSMQTAEKILLEHGYQHASSPKTAAELNAYMNAKPEHAYNFYHNDKGILVEMHWRFWPLFFSSVNPCQVWERRQQTTLNDLSVPTMTMEDYLLVLCMHGSRHMWTRLSWLSDIAVLLYKYPELNWTQVLDQAKQWGCERMLYLGLYLACEWMHASLPSSVIQKISTDRSIKSLANVVHQRIFRSAEQPIPLLDGTRYQLQARERLQDKAVYIESFIYWLFKGRLNTAPE